MDREQLEKTLKRREEVLYSHYSKETKKDIMTATLERYKEDKIEKFYSTVMEECGELIQQVSKLCREKIEPNDIGLLEEMVDVELSIKMLKLLMGTDKNTIKHIEDIKLDRLLERLQKR